MEWQDIKVRGLCLGLQTYGTPSVKQEQKKIDVVRNEGWVLFEEQKAQQKEEVAQIQCAVLTTV